MLERLQPRQYAIPLTCYLPLVVRHIARVNRQTPGSLVQPMQPKYTWLVLLDLRPRGRYLFSCAHRLHRQPAYLTHHHRQVHRLQTLHQRYVHYQTLSRHHILTDWLTWFQFQVWVQRRVSSQKQDMKSSSLKAFNFALICLLSSVPVTAASNPAASVGPTT